MADSFSAVWVSHTSLSDFIKCPRSYYLRNIYKDKKTGHKIQVISPPLALGQAVHDVIESLSIIPTNERFNVPLREKYEASWKKVSGKRGGFPNADIEERYKQRGALMLERVMRSPGPLINKAVKIKMDLPHFWLSPEDNIILCGKIDWLEYFPETDSVHIIDFKTGKGKEDPDSLQLPIYRLLVDGCQKREVVKASYWYLENNDEMEEKPLPDLGDARAKVLKIAKAVKLARQFERFACPHGGCSACKPLEAVLRGEGEFVGENEYRQDMYILSKDENTDESEIL
jgi:hypothetical protein